MKPCLAALAALALAAAAAVAGEEGRGPANDETALAAAASSAAPQAAGRKPLRLKIAVNDIYCSKTACDCIGTSACR